MVSTLRTMPRRLVPAVLVLMVLLGGVGLRPEVQAAPTRKMTIPAAAFIPTRWTSTSARTFGRFGPQAAAAR